MSDIGIMGGTFNPVHYGHLIAAEEALNFLNLEKVLFIPNSIPPHKHDPELISGEYRLEMLKLAIASNPKFEVSDINKTSVCPVCKVLRKELKILKM